MKLIRMTKMILFYFIINFASTIYVFSQCNLEFTGMDTLVDIAVDLYHKEYYFDAIKICEDMIKKYPDNPIGYLGEAVIYYGIMSNYWINKYDSEFDSLINLGIIKSEKALEKYNEDADCYFIYGGALGFRGLYRIRKGQWFGAFVDGISGYRNLKKAYKINNKLYDAYYGLGLFYYWKSSKVKALTFLKLMKDEREKGIEYIKIAIKKGRFARFEGQFTLIQIYYFEDRYDEALNECLALKKEFSKDPIWLYLMAKILDKKENYQEAQKYFLSLIEKLTQSSFEISMGLLTECHYGIAKCQYYLGNYNDALDQSNIALEYSNKRIKEKEIDGPLLDFDVILERLNKLNKKIKNELNHQNKLQN